MRNSDNLKTLGALRALFSPKGIEPRSRGSVTEFGLDVIPAEREAVEFRPVAGAEFGAARYFRVHAPEVVGRVGAVKLADLPAAMPYQRRAAPHGHGDELFVDTPLASVNLPRVDTITIIIGPDSEPPAGSGSSNVIGWTWHPGEPLAPLAPGATPNGNTGVKLHNG